MFSKFDYGKRAEALDEYGNWADCVVGEVTDDNIKLTFYRIDWAVKVAYCSMAVLIFIIQIKYSNNKRFSKLFYLFFKVYQLQNMRMQHILFIHEITS